MARPIFCLPGVGAREVPESLGVWNRFPSSSAVSSTSRDWLRIRDKLTIS